jgi:hypothetical protein
MKTSNRNDGKQSITELWESIANLSRHVTNDNALGDSYPLEVRSNQLHSLRVMLDEIEKHHDSVSS